VVRHLLEERISVGDVEVLERAIDIALCILRGSNVCTNDVIDAKSISEVRGKSLAQLAAHTGD
jgi:hypothetical protein